MTQEQLRKIREQIPKDEKIVRCYRAVEGDMRVITVNQHGEEIRYTVSFEADVKIRKF